MDKRDITFIMDGNFIFYENMVYSPHMHYHAFAARYSKSFNNVYIFARAFDKEKPIGFKVAEDNVTFVRAPSNRGLKSYIINIFKVIQSVLIQIKASDILILRFPGNLAIIALLLCVITNKKFCVEVVAEPKDYFTKENGFGKFYFIYRFIHCTATKIAVKKAQIVRYVTTEYLQKNYPAEISKAYGFTDVYLANLGTHKKVINVERINRKIVNVAMMHNDSKGHNTLIEVCSILKKKGIEVFIEFIGDGIKRAEYEALAKKLNVENNITFHGVVSGGEQLTTKLLDSDLFILPSSQEGMPRSLLEAMYLYLPCLATGVGGIPELLPQSSIIPVNDAFTLAEKIEYIFTDPKNLIDLQNIIMNSIRKLDEDSLSSLYKEYISALNLKG